MNFSIPPNAALALCVALAALSMACQPTTQRVVQQGFQAEGDRVKFLYEEVPGHERGILECRVADDGELYDCLEISLVFPTDDQ